MRLIAVLLLVAATLISAARADVQFDLTVLVDNQCYACGVYAIGDIDLDGQNDIVAGEGGPTLSWYPSPINRATKHTIASGTGLGFEIHVGDVDNDGDLDVMSSTGGITWWENPLKPDGNPATDSWKKHAYGSGGTSSNGGSHDFKVGDINNDGRLDMVERDKETPWHFYLQTAGGGWQTFTVNAANNVEGTALGDIDGDGDLEISDGLAWFECPDNPASQTWTRHDLGSMHPQTRVVIADLNGDKRPDILAAPAEFGGNETMWYEAPQNPRTGTWKKHVLLTHSDPNFHTLQVGDIDLDGNNDILAATTNWSNHPADWRRLVFIWYNTSGNFSSWDEQKWVSGKGIWQSVLGDVGSDGDLDIIGADFNAGNRGEFYENPLDPGTGLRQSPRSSSAASVRARARLRIIFAPDGTVSAPYVVSNASGSLHDLAVFDLMGRRVAAQMPELQRLVRAR